MAIQINPRIAIIAGVGALVVAGAAAWFFLFEEDAPPPPQAVAKAPAAASKAVEAPAKSGAAPAKPAAAAAKQAPIPTDPDKLVAEIIETSGLKKQIGMFSAEVAHNTNASGQDGAESADARMVQELAARHFAAEGLAADIANGVKSAFEAEKMGRLLELLRQPIAAKMAALEARPASKEEKAKFAEEFRTNPPSAARQKLILSLDEMAKTSELGVQITVLAAREMVDAMFEGLQKAGRRPPREARQLFNTQIGAAEPQMRSGFRTMLHITYRDISDEELTEYVKLLESETGRWGLPLLVNALRSAIEKRVRPFARDMAQLVVAKQLASKPAELKDAAAAAPAGKEAERPAPAPVAAAPVEQPGYSRPANIKPLYSRYNDLVTATVMRDPVAVKELLADGKDPNARQSDGFTPLMIATANGDTALAEMLLARKADPNLRAPGGQSALALARGRNSADLVRLLERHGAKN